MNAIFSLFFIVAIVVAVWYVSALESGRTIEFWRVIPSPIRRFFRILGESYWRLLLFFLALVVVVWGSSEQIWGVWILVVAPAGILLSENSAKVKVGLQTMRGTVGTAIRNIMLTVGFLAAVGLLIWIVVAALADFEDWNNRGQTPTFQEGDRNWWIEPIDPGYGKDRCIGDCNDMDNDGRTWNDIDRDGDGLYESNP